MVNAFLLHFVVAGVHFLLDVGDQINAFFQFGRHLQDVSCVLIHRQLNSFRVHQNHPPLR